ncbi:MAG: DUF1273 family protein [Clostridia bacterium]|nr:DUF1273 family protein [Clostridia bacterium]
MRESKTGICCFTGHREIADGHLTQLPQSLDRVLEELIAEGVTVFRAGGAMGFDTIAALKVLEKKKSYPHVRLELYLPCRDQTRGWSETGKHAYQYVLERADSFVYLRETYVKGCMHERNRALVQGADVCVTYCVSNMGGTAYTVGYARKNGLRLINLADRME